jgi:hypothetical protein
MVRYSFLVRLSHPLLHAGYPGASLITRPFLSRVGNLRGLEGRSVFERRRDSNMLVGLMTKVNEKLINLLRELRACVPSCGGNSILRYPSLEFFFHSCPITNDLKSAKALTSPLQAAFNGETCLRSRHPSMRRIWI